MLLLKKISSEQILFHDQVFFDILFPLACALLLIYGAKRKDPCLLIIWFGIAFISYVQYLYVFFASDWDKPEVRFYIQKRRGAKNLILPPGLGCNWLCCLLHDCVHCRLLVHARGQEDRRHGAHQHHQDRARSGRSSTGNHNSNCATAASSSLPSTASSCCLPSAAAVPAAAVPAASPLRISFPSPPLNGGGLLLLVITTVICFLWRFFLLLL